MKEKLIYFVKFIFKGNDIFIRCSTREEVIFKNGNDYNKLIIGNTYEIVYDENNMEICAVGAK